jgi:hypothetical protein
MLTAALLAAALSGAAPSGQVAVIATTPQPAEARREGEEAEPTRRVCRFERATGSNMQQRVCRDVPRPGNFQDAQTREFMRSHQRIRFPDEGVPSTPPGPNG